MNLKSLGVGSVGLLLAGSSIYGVIKSCENEAKSSQTLSNLSSFTGKSEYTIKYDCQSLNVTDNICHMYNQAKDINSNSALQLIFGTWGIVIGLSATLVATHMKDKPKNNQDTEMQ